MEINTILIVIIASVASIFSIATSALGLQYVPKNTKEKAARGFLTFNVVVSSLVLLLCLVYFGLKLKNRTSGTGLSSLTPPLLPSMGPPATF